MTPYEQLLTKVLLVHAAIHEKNPPSKQVDLQRELVDFNEGCLTGYADDLNPEEIEKLYDLLNDSRDTYLEQGHDVVFIQKAIETLENAFDNE